MEDAPRPPEDDECVIIIMAGTRKNFYDALKQYWKKENASILEDYSNDIRTPVAMKVGEPWNDVPIARDNRSNV